MPVDNDKPVRKFTSFVERMGKRVVNPQDSEANALQEKERMIDEYNSSLQGAPQSSLPAVWRSSPEDRVNGGRYGSRTGEERIDVSEMVRPLGGTTSAPQKNNPNDGHHQLAVLEEGERVLTPQQNKQYETEHSLGKIPLYDDGGDVPPDPLAVGQYADPSAANAVASASPDQQPELSTMGRIQNAAGQAQNALGKVLGQSQGGDIPEAQTRMYPVEGLSAKVFDDGGVVEDDKNKKNDEDMKGAPVDFGGRVLEQPNPPVRPMADTDSPDTDRLSGNARMDIANAGVDKQHPVADVSPDAVRDVSTGTSTAQMKPIVSGPTKASAPVDEVKSLPLQTPGLGRMGMGVMSPEEVASASMGQEVHTPEELKFQRNLIKHDMMTHPDDLVALGKDQLRLNTLANLNPYGGATNHPGTLGKILHTLGEVGNVAGEAFLPNLIAKIPGSEANRRFKEEQGLGKIKFAEDVEKEKAETNLANANALGLKGQGKTVLTDKGVFQWNPRTQAYDIRVGGTPVRNLGQELAEAQNEYLAATTPEERNAAADRMRQIQATMQGTQKLTDKREAILNYAKAHNLDPSTPEGFNQARVAMEKEDTAVKAEAAYPMWQRRAQFQQQLNIEANRLNNINADSSTRGLDADKLAQKSEAQWQQNRHKLQLVNEAIDNSDANQVAANVAPLLATLGIVATEGGVKRLNREELAKFLPANGSAFRWMEANFDKLTEGSLPDGYQKNIKSLMNSAISSLDATHEAELNSIDTYIRRGAQMPAIVPNKTGGGHTVKPVPSTPSPKSTVAPEGHQVKLDNGHTATKKSGKWVDDVTGQEVK